jgi:hypothetical protein
MSRVLTPATRIFQGSNTATTGGTITLSTAAAVGYYNFRDRYANGATGVPLFLSDGTSFEYSVGTFNRGGGDATTDTISSRTVTLSSSGIAVPIAWGAGARNAQCDVSPLDFLFASNSLSEMSMVQLAAAMQNLRSGMSATITGGANGKVVRYLSDGTVTEASNTDSPDLLRDCMFRYNGILYTKGNLIPVSGGFTLGPQWLGTSGNMLISAPMISTTVAVLRLGRVIATTMFLFDPSEPMISA